MLKQKSKGLISGKIFRHKIYLSTETNVLDTTIYSRGEVVDGPHFHLLFNNHARVVPTAKQLRTTPDEMISST